MSEEFGNQAGAISLLCCASWPTIARALTAAALIAVASACSHPTVSSPPSADARMLSADDVRAISHVDLDADPRYQLDRPHHSDDPNVPAPCRAVFEDASAFGTSWTQFRSAIFIGETHRTPPGGAVQAHGIAEVAEAVGVYPDSDTARATLDRLVSALKSCAALHATHYAFTLNNSDPDTVALDHLGQWKIIYRLKSRC